MDHLVIMKDQQAVTSSLQVAETFDKNHRDVMKRIRDLTAQNIAVGKMFIQSTYLNRQGHSQPMYYMNRDGFTLLVVGFTGKKALEFKMQYIEAFNQMENELKQGYSTKNVGGYQVPSNYRGALLLAADLQEQVDIMKPKALFADSVSASHTTILVGDLAKILKGNGINIGARRLFQWMRDNGYLIKRKGADYNSPTQKSMNLGLFKIKESSHVNGDGVTVVTKTPKVTGKGQNYFVNKFLKDNKKVEA